MDLPFFLFSPQLKIYTHFFLYLHCGQKQVDKAEKNFYQNRKKHDKKIWQETYISKRIFFSILFLSASMQGSAFSSRI